MEMSPQQVRTASFRTARKGFDPNEVTNFLRDVADALESAQNQSTAMEARARAAVARLQELTAAQEAAPPPVAEPVHVEPDQAETITRTLLLAQRTADTTIAEARAEAERLLASARDEAATTIDSTREMAALLLDEARAEARKVTEEERRAADNEVQALLARRDFLESDVDHLERFLVEQRSRLREASAALIEIAERVPGGLGQVRRPLLSAADDAEVGAPVDVALPDGAPVGEGLDAPMQVDDRTPQDPHETDEVAEPDVLARTGEFGVIAVDPTVEEPPVAAPAPPVDPDDDGGGLAALAAALSSVEDDTGEHPFPGPADPTPPDATRQLRFRPENPDDADRVGR